MQKFRDQLYFDQNNEIQRKHKKQNNYQLIKFKKAKIFLIQNFVCIQVSLFSIFIMNTIKSLFTLENIIK